jgi:hypothetical protein
MPRSERIFGPGDRDELLKSLAIARMRESARQAAPRRTVIKSSVQCIVADIDDMATLLTRNPDHFRGKSPNPSYG